MGTRPDLATLRTTSVSCSFGALRDTRRPMILSHVPKSLMLPYANRNGTRTVACGTAMRALKDVLHAMFIVMVTQRMRKRHASILQERMVAYVIGAGRSVTSQAVRISDQAR